MENIANISQRIKQFIDYKGLTVNKFSVIVGVSNSYFGKMSKKNGSIGIDIIEKILREFPELSSEWLILGRDQMLRTNQMSVSEPAAPYGLQNRVTELEKIIQDKQRIIELLEDKLNNQK